MSNYYHEHSKQFIEDTFECDMNELYRFFEAHLNEKGTILDLGFGSGRDALYFQSKGYEVYAIDPEIEFVKHGQEISLKHVYQGKAETMEFCNLFDGIWACASLLHVPSKDLNLAFRKCAIALKERGIMYASFKYGDFEGERNGRYYLDINETSIKKYLQDTGLTIIETSLTEDVRPDKDEKWINFLLKKQ